MPQQATILGSGGGGGGSNKVTNAGNITKLTTNTNWTNNLYTGATITGQSTGDWYNDGSFQYQFITATTVSRIPYSNL